MLVSLVLGLEHSCPWPRECLSSERLSLASDFFCVLGLEPCVLGSTSGGYVGADATSSPPFTLATALHRLQPAQGRASTTPMSCRARHCNVCVKRTRPDAVDWLG